MDQLPLELYLKIFGHLDLSDLMSLRLVCKKFEYTVKKVKICELVFEKDFWKSSNFSSAIEDKLWLFVNEIKQFDSFFNFSAYLLSSSFLSSGPFNVRFLKRLSIESLSKLKGIELEDINRFCHLEHLEIGFDQQPRKTSMWSLSDRPARKVPRLQLPSLRSLRIISYFNQKGLEIVTPKLVALHLPEPKKVQESGHARYALDERRLHLRTFTNEISSLKFKYPESIRFLSICLHFSWSRRTNYVRNFKMVEYLQTYYHVQLENIAWLDDPIWIKLIPEFPKLKRLNLRGEKLSDFDLKKFTRLVERVAALERPDLKIYYLNIELSNEPALIDDFEFYHKAYIEKENSLFHLWAYEFALKLKNYPLLDDKREPFHNRRINYSRLMNMVPMLVKRDKQFGEDANGVMNEAALTNPLFVDFLKKFPKIVKIDVDKKIENEDQFTHFVKGCKNLKALHLEGCQLSQAFFEQLPSISLLNVLWVAQTGELNMDFLFRMNHLSICATNQQLSPKLVLKLAKNRYARLLGCVIQNNLVAIRRLGKDEYLLKVGSVGKVVNFESLIEHLFRLKAHSPKTITIELWLKFWFEF